MPTKPEGETVSYCGGEEIKKSLMEWQVSSAVGLTVRSKPNIICKWNRRICFNLPEVTGGCFQYQAVSICHPQDRRLTFKVIFYATSVRIRVCLFYLLPTGKKIEFDIQIVTSQRLILYVSLGEKNPLTPFYICKKSWNMSIKELDVGCVSDKTKKKQTGHETGKHHHSNEQTVWLISGLWMYADNCNNKHLSQTALWSSQISTSPDPAG